MSRYGQWGGLVGPVVGILVLALGINVNSYSQSLGASGAAASPSLQNSPPNLPVNQPLPRLVGTNAAVQKLDRDTNYTRITLPGSLSRTPSTPPTVTEIGPNHRVLSVARPARSDVAGTNQSAFSQRGGKQHHVTEMATGMHYRDPATGQWAESDPTFDAVPGGFIAERLQHHVYLNAELNSSAAVTAVSGDHHVLRSTPTAIALFDSASGVTQIIALLTNVTGVQTAPGQIIYADAFTPAPGIAAGVCADVIYSLDRGSLEQDVRLTGRINLADFGTPSFQFPPATTRLQILTEFFAPPEPEHSTRVLRVEKDHRKRAKMHTPDLVDDQLGFGELVLATGQARGGEGTNSFSVPVAKTYTTDPASGRTFLVESVEFADVQSALLALPVCSGGSARAGRGIGAPGLLRKHQDLVAALPSAPAAAHSAYALAGASDGPPNPRAKPTPTPPRSAAGPTRFAAAAGLAARAGVTIDYQALVGRLNSATVFAGDTTYFISGPVLCVGPVTIEGGAVFKYPPTASSTPVGPLYTPGMLRIYNSLTCKTTPYRPAIFTATDDDSVGESCEGATLHGGTLAYHGPVPPPHYYYAAPALWLACTTVDLSNLRFCYAQEAVHCDLTVLTSASVTDSQFVQCLRGLTITGAGGACSASSSCGTTLAVNNSLFSRVTTSVLAQSPVTVCLTHCTVDQATAAFVAQSSVCSFVATNSIFANCPSIMTASSPYLYPSLNGWDNGFWAAPVFGGLPLVETCAPFFPGSYLDNNGNPVPIISTYQGGYYLREDSPFAGAGITNLAAGLIGDLARRTTTPPEIMVADDHDDSFTLQQEPIREGMPPDLGYHYAAVDYVIDAVTVNNCTLSIDQGTVLALTSALSTAPNYIPFWGIRVNPGGRLRVNGVPTNHVTFTHVDCVQESPCYYWQPVVSPMITFKGLWLQNVITGNPPQPTQPLAAADLHFADFPVLDGGAAHFSNLYGDGSITYDLVGDLTLDSCLFQGGEVDYAAGSAMSRTFTLRNNVFERCGLVVVPVTSDAVVEESFSVFNNLFYSNDIALVPIAGTNWTFTDNIFHGAFLDTDGNGNLLNGPVQNNHHNAYVGMPFHLQPGAPPGTDVTLSTLPYVRGPLGNFYLPTTAAALFHNGSQPAAAAGLYHFTSYITNVKEAANPVNMGPHYLALVGSLPADTDGDGIPDFIEDRNGNGIADTTETDWTIANTAPSAILGPPAGTVVTGNLALEIGLDPLATIMVEIDPQVDGRGFSANCAVFNPATTMAKLEVDTRQLPNGPHTIGALIIYATNYYGNPMTSIVPGISIIVSNDVSYPLWQDLVETTVEVHMVVPSTTPDCILNLYTQDYPYSLSPPAVDLEFASADANGSLDFSQPMGLVPGVGPGGKVYASVLPYSSATATSGVPQASRRNKVDLPWPAVGQ